MRTHILLTGLLALFTTGVYAQRHDNVWLFGSAGGGQSPYDSTGVTLLDFSNGNKPEVIEKASYKVNFYGTNAGICDSSGGLQFYTNGEHIYSHNHNIMPNGNKITAIIDGLGYILPQGAIALPFPGHTKQYVLLSIEKDPINSFGWKLFYHVIEMEKHGGLGEVTVKRQLLVQDSLSFGKISAAKHANGRDWWFVVPHEYSNIYYIGLLTPDGIQLDTCIVGDVVSDGLGQSTFSPDGTIYIKVDDNISLNQIRIFDFDRCSGKLSNYRNHLIIDSSTFGIGCAISKDSKYLYVTNTFVTYQFDLTSTDVFSTETIVAEWDGTLFKGIWPTNFYLAQSAPDGRIIINSTSSSRSMHFINFPTKAGYECQFLQNGLQTPTQIRFEMPNFPNYRLGPLDGSACDTLGLDNHPLARWRWEQEDTLQPLGITFTDLSDYEPTNWYWTFGDGQSSTAQHPVHAYDAQGVYTVCLVAGNANSADTLCRVLELGVSGTGDTDESISAGISPNPFSDRLVVFLSNGITASVFRLFDAKGRLMREAAVSAGYQNILTNDLPSGLYFWRIETDGEVLQQGKCLKIW